uniref:Uncharacterized protein n=1 Tax=Panagrolaimus sp. ES5 TaxID=591445 RepID=A0AC34FYI7_9BILA
MENVNNIYPPKRTTINDDIEMVEEDSDAEETDINNHTESVSSAAAQQKVNNENIDDTGADDNNDDTVSSTNNSDAEDALFDTSRKIQKLKRTHIDEDICMIEADYDGDNIDGEDFDPPEPIDITETPDEFQLSDLNASQNNEINTGHSDSPNTNEGRQ